MSLTHFLLIPLSFISPIPTGFSLSLLLLNINSNNNNNNNNKTLFILNKVLLNLDDEQVLCLLLFVWESHPDLFPSHEKPLAESKFKVVSSSSIFFFLLYFLSYIITRIRMIGAFL